MIAIADHRGGGLAIAPPPREIGSQPSKDLAHPSSIDSANGDSERGRRADVRPTSEVAVDALQRAAVQDQGAVHVVAQV